MNFGERVLEPLTERELQVIRLVAAGRRNRDIARELGISIKMVEFHLSNVMSKFGARSRTGAVTSVMHALQLDLAALSPVARAGG